MADFHILDSCDHRAMTAIENDIKAYIADNPNGDYQMVLRKDHRFEVFLALSDLRVGLFSWYDFPKQASLLEVGAGFGALTGVFCQKCKNVTVIEPSVQKAKAISMRCSMFENLAIYAASIDSIALDRKYDYIVLSNGFDSLFPVDKNLEVYVDFIIKLKELLKPDGIILLTAENRYGLKYFCGEPDLYTGKLFDVFGNFDYRQEGRRFSQKELEFILSNAEVGAYRFYYPLPDYRMPQLIYTDAHLPDQQVQERLLLYHPQAASLLMDEKAMYQDIIDSHVFPFFANSYLLECGASSRFDKMTHAVLSTDRGRDKAFATILYPSYVKKQAMFTAGIMHTEALHENHLELQNNGIPVIEEQILDGCICMPLVNKMSLIEYLQNRKNIDQPLLWGILKKLNSFIEKSSESVPDDKNAIRYYAPYLDWGIILKRAYIELVGMNCFYEKGQFCFFDQEYVRENYPAKYVLFRAIKYLYILLPRLEYTLSQEQVKEYFGLKELWPFLEQEEEKFQVEVHHHERYPQYYKWTEIPWENVERNKRRLLDGNRFREKQLFSGIQGKEIIVFGSGQYFRAYMQEYGQRYRPSFVLDNNKKSWNTVVDGIKIISPAVLSKLSENDYRVIICVKNHTMIEAQLEELEFYNYRVYML